MANIDERLEALERQVRGLMDSATVSAYTQARHDRYMQDHAQWLQEHDRAMVEARQRDKALDERIEKLVSAIGEMIPRRGE